MGYENSTVLRIYCNASDEKDLGPGDPHQLFMWNTDRFIYTSWVLQKLMQSLSNNAGS